MSLAAENMYRPIWSSAIPAELEFHEAVKLRRQGVPVEDAQSRAEYLVNQMRQAFDDAEIEGWEGLEGTTVFLTGTTSTSSLLLLSAGPERS